MKQLGWTSLEQSEKLIEAGLDPNTADMFYIFYPFVQDIAGLGIGKPEEKGDTPCWSLGALLELMPPYLFDFSRGIDLNIYRNLNGVGWHVSYLPNNIFDLQVDKFRQITNGHNAIDSAVEMIIWLLEQNYIKKENSLKDCEL
jgi:hypothetical protein